MKTGIIAAADGKNINKELIYDSRIPHLLVDPRRTVNKLMDIVEITGGTALVSSGNIGVKIEEIFSIEHGLPYVPRVTTSFYVHDSAPILLVGKSPIGTFSSDKLNMLPISIGVPVEYLYITIDATHFKVMHSFEYVSFSDPAATSTAKGPEWKITLKYMINNNSRKYPYSTRSVY